ncbi:MAG: hypothetical protein LBK50_00700 [Candidatus Nomurabacteria bacterium]|jgi:hypothetical protein|nr:hypothetical protein [Candidatus Nomurabacteria bacterium]
MEYIEDDSSQETVNSLAELGSHSAKKVSDKWKVIILSIVVTLGIWGLSMIFLSRFFSEAPIPSSESEQSISAELVDVFDKAFGQWSLKDFGRTCYEFNCFTGGFNYYYIIEFSVPTIGNMTCEFEGLPSDPSNIAAVNTKIFICSEEAAGEMVENYFTDKYGFNIEDRYGPTVHNIAEVSVKDYSVELLRERKVFKPGCYEHFYGSYQMKSICNVEINFAFVKDFNSMVQILDDTLSFIEMDGLGEADVHIGEDRDEFSDDDAAYKFIKWHGGGKKYDFESKILYRDMVNEEIIDIPCMDVDECRAALRQQFSFLESIN